MNEISCLIKEVTYVENKPFYIIRENQSEKEHLVSKNQIKVFKNVDSFQEYDFLKEENKI